MAFRHMVDMTRSRGEKAEEVAETMPSVMDIPDVPYGLCLCLTETELEKLGLDDDCEVGDLLHLFCMTKVTSVSKHDSGNGPNIRIELAIISMSVEDEATEEAPDD